MKKTTGIIILLLFVVFSSFAQQGYVRGKVIDAETGEPLIGATVAVPGTTRGTTTDFDGNYSLNLDPGTYTISISYVSYETQTFEEVEVTAGETTIINANLGEATTELQEVVVTARARERTETALQVKKRKSAVVMDGISAQHISRLGDSDAAGALKRVTGVTVQGGKYVYVRGLSDRYMTITLNGAVIPGLDPNFNTVQMDLFPANIIENMMVSKTYTPDHQSFTAGLVDVQTKDFPAQFTLQASASVGFNSQAHFNDNFLSYEHGDLDWIGFDDGIRDVPENLQNVELVEPSQVISEPQQMFDQSAQFNKILGTEMVTAPINQSYSFSVGNQLDIFNNQSLGFVAAFTYSNKSSFFADGRRDDYEAQNATLAQPTELLSEDNGSNDIIWSGLLSTSIKIDNNNRIRLTYLRNQNGIRTSRYMNGATFASDSYDMSRTNLEYLERSLSAYQIGAKHVITGLNNFTIDWMSSYTHSIQNEPDIRFFINEIIELDGGEDTLYEVRSNRKPERRYREMWEYNWHSKIDFTAPINVGDEEVKIKFGGSFLEKFRNSEEDRYTIEVIGSTPTDVFRESGNPADYVVDQNLFGFNDQLLGSYYGNDEFTNQIYSFNGKDIIPAGYIMADFPLFGKLRVVGGARFERTDMLIYNKIDTVKFNRRSQIARFEESRSDTIFDNVLPAINLTYQFNESMNLRLGYSKSISRPTFRERAPFQYYEYSLNATVLGNPKLGIGLIDNFDIRWEYYFNPGELLSVSGFYKNLTNTIERYKVSSTNNLISYRNGNDAIVYGAELEFRKNLDFIGLNNIQFGVNASYIYSETDVDSTRLELARSVVEDFPSTRPMFGQAPYILNFYIAYNNDELGLASNLGFNVDGEKIVVVNRFQTPDVYEKPYPALNFNISKSIFNDFIIKFSAENIINPNFEQSFELDDGTEYFFRKYTNGRTFSLSLSYAFSK